ncbi:unnamed protein product [Cyprideis torosa]|uniref:FACT complex subunit SSRP1 n=1 Tax=Cyprideis torosa TaxID=163714 RepID=A0A7R8W8N2_9CRUS|nr:unnamed protein product [Cyprideis torosa]CAG0884008.1 unnamed protein product [Cyprideis torosa]
MTDYQEYSDVSQEVMGAMVPGRLKLTSAALTFKAQKTGKTDTIPAGDIELLNWQKIAGTWGVRIFLKNGSLHRFGGFVEDDQDKLTRFFKDNYHKDMSLREYSVKGWNWGTARFKGKVLTFEVGGQPDFDIPLVNVSHVVAGKQEVTMEFHKNDDAPVDLCEMRFHIPATGEGDSDPVEAFKDEVMKQASVITASGDAIAIFTEVNCITPRGRYQMKFYQKFIGLHGKAFDYRIPMTNVLRLFLLPHRDTRLMFFVISLDPPIKQGMTRYPFLIFQFNHEDDIDIELPFTDEELKEKFEGRLEREMSGPTYEVMSKLFRALTQRKITTPGKFIGHSSSPAVSCSYKAQAGYLYPLERGFLYVHKPTIHIRLEEVNNVNFARSGGAATRSFDLEIETKTGQMHTFSSIEKEEYPKLFEYIVGKKLRIKNRGGKADRDGLATNFSDSEEEGEEHDPYLHYAKAEGNEKSSSEEDEDESSEDEDFKPPEEESDHDDGRPKRPQSAYFLWLNENRENIKEEGMSVTDVSKKAGELWRKLSSSDKKKKKSAAVANISPSKIRSKEFISSSEDSDDASPSSSSPAKKGGGSKKEKGSKKAKDKEKDESSGGGSDEEEEESEAESTPAESEEEDD